MPLTIKIPDSEVKSLKEYYQLWLANFLRRLEPMAYEWEQNYRILKQLGINPHFSFVYDRNGASGEIKPIPPANTARSVDMSNGYDKSWSWMNKSLYVINKDGPSTPVHIVDRILKEFEPELDERKARNSLPATLSMAARDGKIFRSRNKNGDYEYDILKDY